MTAADALRAGPPDDPDRYILEQAVSAGSEGVLYRGATSDGGVAAAIKMLHPGHHAAMDEWRERWTEQAALLQHLASPGLVRVRASFVGPLPHDAGAADEDTTSLYLVMDWVEGQPLWTWAQERPDATADDLLLQLLPVGAALDLLHSGVATGGQTLLHGDVKPGNILVTERGSVLVDLGSVHAFDGSTWAGTSGTSGYLAPEAREGAGSAASDRYALGCVAIALLAGAEPPADASVDDLRTLLAPSRHVAGNPALLDHLLEMVAPDPADRPLHCANWLAQLRQSSIDPITMGPTLPPVFTGAAEVPAGMAVVDAKPGRRRLLVRLGALVAVAAVVVAGLLVARDPADDDEARTGTGGPTTATTVVDAGVTSTTEPGSAISGPPGGDADVGGSTGPTVPTGGTGDDAAFRSATLALTRGPRGATTTLVLPGCTSDVSYYEGDRPLADAIEYSAHYGHVLTIPDDLGDGSTGFWVTCNANGLRYTGQFTVVGNRPSFGFMPFFVRQGDGATVFDGDGCGQVPNAPSVSLSADWVVSQGSAVVPAEVVDHLTDWTVQATTAGRWPEVSTAKFAEPPAAAAALMVTGFCAFHAPDGQWWKIQYGNLYIPINRS